MFKQIDDAESQRVGFLLRRRSNCGYFSTQRYGPLSLLFWRWRCAPSPALAGAWTMPQGRARSSKPCSAGSARGALRRARGPRESKIEAQTYLEYGLTDRLTLVGQLSA